MPSVIWNRSVTGNFWIIEGCVCKSGQAEEASQTTDLGKDGKDALPRHLRYSARHQPATNM